MLVSRVDMFRLGFQDPYFRPDIKSNFERIHDQC